MTTENTADVIRSCGGCGPAPGQKAFSLSLSPRGTSDVMAADRTPGIAATRPSNCWYASRIAGGLAITVGDRATCVVRTLRVLNPGSTRKSRQTLCIISPAPASKITARPISTATKTPSTR